MVAYGAVIHSLLFERIRRRHSETWEAMGCPESAFAWRAQSGVADAVKELSGTLAADDGLRALAKQYRLFSVLLCVFLMLSAISLLIDVFRV